MNNGNSTYLILTGNVQGQPGDDREAVLAFGVHYPFAAKYLASVLCNENFRSFAGAKFKTRTVVCSINCNEEDLTASQQDLRYKILEERRQGPYFKVRAVRMLFGAHTREYEELPEVTKQLLQILGLEQMPSVVGFSKTHTTGIPL